MIKTIYQFGEQLQKIDTMQHYFEVFGAPYSERAENAKVLVANIQNRMFSGFDLPNYSKNLNSKYLF